MSDETGKPVTKPALPASQQGQRVTASTAVAGSTASQITSQTVSGQQPPGARVAPPAANKPSVQAADSQAALLALLKVEADARDATSESDLVLIIANETRKLTRARQIFVLSPSISGSLEVVGISSIPVVERNAPLVIFIETLVAHSHLDEATDITQLDMSGITDDGTAQAYPFRSLVFVPLGHGSRGTGAGFIMAREEPWAEQDLIIARRLASAFAHAWLALNGPPRRFTRHLLSFSRVHMAAIAVLAASMFVVHVPLTALAPVEIVPRDPFVVAAAIDGVIESIAVEVNQKVKKGDLLVKIADTTLRNRFEVAEREVQVAEARLKQSNQAAFSDPRGMHDIGIARAELALKVAERDFAKDLLAKTEIHAERDGIAIYSDKRELVGRPVAVGERILEVADAQMIEARIELPVADAIALSPGSYVKLFLDSDPLRPWPASLKRADYKAKLADGDVLSFRVVASILESDSRPLPRLGVRGTAQVTGDKNVPLGLFLFRRPIAALRQWTGL